MYKYLLLDLIPLPMWFLIYYLKKVDGRSSRYLHYPKILYNYSKYLSLKNLVNSYTSIDPSQMTIFYEIFNEHYFS